MTSLTFNILQKSVWCIFFSIISCVASKGYFILYRPRDISNDCVMSHHLRFDLSFGMGMSDTITLLLRTQTELDYQCEIEIVTEYTMHLIIVIRLPRDLDSNCALNQEAISIMDNNNMCQPICDIKGKRQTVSPYFILTTKWTIRFHFISNSSINSELNATHYQITATSARKKPRGGCYYKDNETLCKTVEDEFCFTNYVVCDGIKNCGVQDWYDERKTECLLPVERLSYAPVIAVIAAVFCAVMIIGHLMSRCLPPLANSFFIFNTNEDNRLCIDPVLIPPEDGQGIEIVIKRTSLIPVPSSSSSEGGKTHAVLTIAGDRPDEIETPSPSPVELTSPEESHIRRTTMWSAKIQDKLRFFTGKQKVVEKEEN